MTSETRRPHVGELLVDLAIVAGAAFYVHTAFGYPPQGRQIPLVVGWLAIGLGALHLLGHVVPALWAVTHDSAARGGAARQGARTAVAERLALPDAAPQEAAPKTSFGEPRQVVYGIAWTAGLLAAVYLVGFAVALPVFFLAYFGALRAWRTAVISAVVMWALTEGLFVYALSVPMPQGLLF